MTRQPAVSYHTTVETFTRGSVARGRNHVILPSFQSGLLCALLPVGGGIVHMILHTFCELGAHENPLGTQGEHANSTQKRPFADPTQGMGTDDMEERTNQTVPTVSSVGIEPRTFLL